MNNPLGILASESTGIPTPPMEDDEILVEAELETQLKVAEYNDAEQKVSTEMLKLSTGKIALRSIESINKLERNDAVDVGLTHNLSLLGVSNESIKTDKESVDAYIARAHEGIKDVANSIYDLIATAFNKLWSMMGSRNAEMRLQIRDMDIAEKAASKINAETVKEINDAKWKKEGDLEVLAGIETDRIAVVAPFNVVKNGMVKESDLSINAGFEAYDYLKKEHNSLTEKLDKINGTLLDEYYYISEISDDATKEEIDVRGKRLDNVLKDVKDVKKAISKARKGLEGQFAYSKSDGSFHQLEQVRCTVSNSITAKSSVKEMADKFKKMNDAAVKLGKDIKWIATNISYENRDMLSITDFIDVHVNESGFVELGDISEGVMAYVKKFNEIMKETSELISKELQFSYFLPKYFASVNAVTFGNLKAIAEKRTELLSNVTALNAEDV